MKKIILFILGIMVLAMVSPLPGYAHGSRALAVGSVWVGPGWGLGWGPYWGAGWGPYWGAGWVVPLYPRYYPYYPPPATVEEPETEYFEAAPQPEQQEYWYYCKKPKGFYPYLKSCPDGWIKVIPNPDNPAKEE